jgi:hypothetical protein
VNYPLDAHSFGEEYSLADLRGGLGDEPGDAGDQEDVAAVEPNGAVFFNYYLHKSDKYGWFIEDLHS